VFELTVPLRAALEGLTFPYAVWAQSVIIIISIIFIERVTKRPTNISFFLLSDLNIASPDSVKQPEIYAKILPEPGCFRIKQWLRDVATIEANCCSLFCLAFLVVKVAFKPLYTGTKQVLEIRY
jgi:hypothetical protein